MNIAVSPLVSVDEARRLLGGRGRGYIYELIKTGQLESVKDQGRRLITGGSILRHVEVLREQTDPLL